MPASRSAASRLVDVAAEQRPQVRVGDRRRRALVLAPDRRHLVRDGDRHARQLLREDLLHALLVVGADVGEEQADARPPRRPRRGSRRQSSRTSASSTGRTSLAVGVEPLVDARGRAAGSRRAAPASSSAGRRAPCAGASLNRSLRAGASASGSTSASTQRERRSGPSTSRRCGPSAGRSVTRVQRPSRSALLFSYVRPSTRRRVEADLRGGAAGRAGLGLARGGADLARVRALARRRSPTPTCVRSSAATSAASTPRCATPGMTRDWTIMKSNGGAMLAGAAAGARSRPSCPARPAA